MTGCLLALELLTQRCKPALLSAISRKFLTLRLMAIWGCVIVICRFSEIHPRVVCIIMHVNQSRRTVQSRMAVPHSVQVVRRVIAGR